MGYSSVELFLLFNQQTLDARYEFGSVKPTFVSDVYKCQICESKNIFLAGGQHCSACGKVRTDAAGNIIHSCMTDT